MRKWEPTDWTALVFAIGLSAMMVAVAVCMIFDCLVNYCHLRLW
jgi:hypothetical protein